MFYTYILISIADPERRYIGHTTDLKRRLVEHNAGKSRHTSKYAPWKIHAYFAFREIEMAQEFERYLKSGSGVAFAKRHFPSS